MIISKKLRELREAHDLTQKQIARILKIDRSTYSYYELGKSYPPIPTLITLARMFNTTMDCLLSHGQLSNIPVHPDTEMFLVLSKPEQLLIMHYRSLPQGDRQMLLDNLRE